jgi:ATP-binding cassette, subfamily B, multidrug efflux pump
MSFTRHHREYQKEQVESKALDWELIVRLLRYLRPYKGLLLLAVLFLLFSKAIEASVPVFIGHISQKILNSFSLAEAEKNVVLLSVIRYCTWILLLLLLSYALDSLNVVLKSWIGQKGIFSMRSEVYEHLLKMPLAYYDHHSVGRLMTRTIHDVDQINQLFAESVIPILGSIFLFIGISIGIAIVDWRVAILMIILLPIVWWLTHRFRYFQRRCYDRIRTVVSAMNTFVQEHLMGASIIRNFGLQQQEMKHFEEINEDHCNAYLEAIHHFSFFIAGIDLLQNMSLILVFVLLVAFAPVNTGFAAGAYFTFSLYTLMFFRPLADLAERYNVLQSAMAAAERIFHVLDQRTETQQQGADLDEIETIAFENVWFAYEKDNWVLKNLSFEVKKGESLAIVGVTGEGKTTIMSLLLRFYDHQKGIIKINGRDIREYALSAVRRQFSVVLQDPVIFSGTIAENISLYNPEIPIAKIEEIIDHLNLHSFINRFSDGLHQQLLERGKSLSIGEMQLISMARAMAHHRTVLVMDEATANIDTATEKIIQKALGKILHEKTSLVIAHRFSTIKHMNRILVLHRGFVAESGTHQQLLQAKGIYEKLYRLQFAS